jgi:hypothetical protein
VAFFLLKFHQSHKHGVVEMPISSVNSSVQNQYPQISSPSANNTADVEVTNASSTSTSTAAANDTVSISAAGQAMANAATGFTTMLQPFNAGRALTAEDKTLIGYPNPSNPYVTSMAATISELREKGLIHGRMTSEYYKLDDGTQASVFDAMPQDAQSKVDMAPLKNRMMAKFAEYKNGSAYEVTKLANDKFLLNLGRDSQSTNSIKAKAMMRDYSA